MNLKNAFAPHIRRTDRASFMSLDVLITLVPLAIFSSVYYGARPVLRMLVGVGTAVVCETLCCLLLRRKPSVLDGTAVVTGGLIGALMSPISPYWLPAVAAAFAILVVKMPFGGTGRNTFNPAAAGIALITQCFSAQLFTYPDPGLPSPIPLDSVEGVNLVTSPAAQLMTGGATVYNQNTLLLGNFPGPIGATAIAVLIACAIYLFSRRTASPWITLPFLAVCALCAVMFPRVAGGWKNSVMLELCSGYLLFAAIFLMTDPVTAPRYWLGRIFYGALGGALTMALRYNGRFEAGACFAVLIMNAFAPVIDRWSWRMVHGLGALVKKIRGGAAI